MWGKWLFFENVPSYTQSDSTMIPQWSQSDLKSPSYTQSDPTVAPKSTSNARLDPKVTPKCSQSHPQLLKVPQSNAKVTPKPLSYAKSDLKVTPKDSQSYPHMPKVTPKWPQSHLHMPKVVPNSLQSLTKSLKSNFTLFPNTCKSQSLEASKPRSLEASRCLGGNREAKLIDLFIDAPIYLFIYFYVEAAIDQLLTNR